MLRAAVRTIAAGGTRYQIFAFKYFLNLFNGCKLCFVKRFKILHKADVVLHLLHVAHAGENGHYARKACVQESINHFFGLFNINFLAVHRQPHHTESEIFLDFIHLGLLPFSSNMFIISHMDSKLNNADFLLLNDGFYDKV